MSPTTRNSVKRSVTDTDPNLLRKIHSTPVSKPRKNASGRKPEKDLLVSKGDHDNDSASLPKVPRLRESVITRKLISPSFSKCSDDSGFISSQADCSVSSICNTPKRKCEQADVNNSIRDANLMNIDELLALGEGNSTMDSAVDMNTTPVSDSDCDWEEVEEKKDPVIPKEGVDIVLEVSDPRQRKKKCLKVELKDLIRKQVNKVRRDMQIRMHKVHLVCWISHLRFVNNVLNNKCLHGLALSLLTSKICYPPKKVSMKYLESFINWFSENFTFKEVGETDGVPLLIQLLKQFNSSDINSKRFLVFVFIIMLRSVGVECRLIMSVDVVTLKPTSQLVLDNSKSISVKHKKGKENVEVINEEQKKSKMNVAKKKRVIKKVLSDNEVSSDEEKIKKRKTPKRETKVKAQSKTKEVMKEENSSGDEAFMSEEELKKRKQSKRKSVKKKKEVIKETPIKSCKIVGDESDTDSEFKPESIKRVSKKIDRRVLSSTDDDDNDVEESVVIKKKGVDVWVEVYVNAVNKWISVDVCRCKVDCSQDLFTRASQPVVYVIAINNNGYMKDVTQRYVPNWHSETRKQRVDTKWWENTLYPYRDVDNLRDVDEDENIKKDLNDKPLPTSITQYKNHPLYVLKRHLLKFEALYPVDAPTLGFVRGEPVYARECVHTLRSRENWYHKEARVVKVKEDPYKIVNTTKYDKTTYAFIRVPLELFGHWQTDLYVPPPAVDGKVPRNEYGNVELFKPSMLPPGTVHLQNPGLFRLARKLNIDCANAMIGFDFHAGAIHPMFDGVVVCEEFKDELLEAWDKEVEESARKEEEKRTKRIYGNWKRLIRGLLIRERLKFKYAFGENLDEDAEDDKPLVEIQKQNMKKKTLK